MFTRLLPACLICLDSTAFAASATADPVYHRMKQLGMSLVTLTDHDSIEGSEPLLGYPGFFLSEEVTARMPSEQKST